MKEVQRKWQELLTTKNDPKYKKTDDFEKSLAFSAPDLVLKENSTSGYTEPLLHQKRLKKSNL